MVNSKKRCKHALGVTIADPPQSVERNRFVAINRSNVHHGFITSQFGLDQIRELTNLKLSLD